MVGKQLVALKRSLYHSHSYNPLTSQEKAITVDTEMAPEEKEPPRKASAEYFLCGQWDPISATTAPIWLCHGKLWTHAINHLYVCLHYNFSLCA